MISYNISMFSINFKWLAKKDVAIIKTEGV